MTVAGPTPLAFKTPLIQASMSKEKLNDPTPVSYWGLVTDLFKKEG